MTDPSFTPERDRELLVVYPSVEQAERARTAVLDAGVSPADVHLDRESDTVASLRAEMRQELTDAWVVPNAGVVYPKESAQGLVLTSAVWVLVGVAVAVPLAFIPFGSTFLVRLILFVTLGVFFGFTIGLVAGPPSAAERPASPPAGARGTTLRVDHDSAELRRLLAEVGPIRLDAVAHDDQPVDTVTTERGRMGDAARDIAANTRGDDYHEQR